MVSGVFPGGFSNMEFFALAQSASHVMSAVSLDDSSMSALAMLGGIIGGWALTGLRQPKPKKVKIDSKDDAAPR
jgi:hypothetical protein